MKLENIINSFKNQHRALQILDIAVIVLLIHDAISLQVSQLTVLAVCLAIAIPVFQDFFKKEK